MLNRSAEEEHLGASFFRDHAQKRKGINAVNYRILGRTGLRVSEIGFGALEIGRNWPNWRSALPDFARPSREEAIRLVHAVIDAGVNFIDTAPAYVDSESILGEALQGRRKNVILGTKCGEWFDGKVSRYDYSYDETFRFVEQSLKLLRTDWLDLLQIHSGSVEVVEQGETMRAMKKLREQGKVRFLGISVDREEAALAAIRSGDYDTVQLSYNAARREIEQTAFAEARGRNVGVIVKDSLFTGRLSARKNDINDSAVRAKIDSIAERAGAFSMPLSEYALRFVLGNPVVASAIVGTRSLEHFRSNLRSCEDTELTQRVRASEGDVPAV